MRDHPFYDSALFWLPLGGAVGVIGAFVAGIGVVKVAAKPNGELWSNAWFDSGVAGVIVGVGMLLWSLVLYLAHQHVNKHLAEVSSSHPVKLPQPAPAPTIARPPATAPRLTTEPAADSKISTREACKLSPKELIRLFSQGATEMQASRLVDTYIGLWREVSATVQEVIEPNRVVVYVKCVDTDQASVTFFFDWQLWSGRVGGLMPNDSIRVVGRVDKVSKYHVMFDHCELVD